MKLFSTGIKASCLLLYVLSASAALAHSPNGHTYKIFVFTSFGTSGSDCFKFDNDGHLRIQGLFRQFNYRHDQLNTQPEAWQAAEVGGLGEYSFHGTVGGSTGQTIIADGMNSRLGYTYILQGVEIQDCGQFPLSKTDAPNSKNLYVK